MHPRCSAATRCGPGLELRSLVCTELGSISSSRAAPGGCAAATRCELCGSGRFQAVKLLLSFACQAPYKLCFQHTSMQVMQIMRSVLETMRVPASCPQYEGEPADAWSYDGALPGPPCTAPCTSISRLLPFAVRGRAGGCVVLRRGAVYHACRRLPLPGE